MDEPFSSPKRRLRRANEHIGLLKAGAQAFFDTKPYARVVEPDPKTGHHLHKLRLTRPAPELLTDLAFEAVEALRATLDQVGYAAAIAGGVKIPKKSHFPIADDVVSLERDVIKRGKCRDIPSDILTLFRGFKPYKCGNDSIWSLNKAANASKHRLITAVGNAVGEMTWNASGDGLMELRIPNWDSSKNEMELGVFASTTQFDVKIAFFIAFGEVEGITGKPAVSTLQAISREVERVVSATEAECRRLGLIT